MDTTKGERGLWFLAIHDWQQSSTADCFAPEAARGNGRVQRESEGSASCCRLPLAKMSATMSVLFLQILPLFYSDNAIVSAEELAPGQQWPAPPGAASPNSDEFQTEQRHPSSHMHSHEPSEQSNDLLSYVSERGFLAAGDDLELLDDATVEEAQQRCSAQVLCSGFTYQINSSSSWHATTTSTFARGTAIPCCPSLELSWS